METPTSNSAQPTRRALLIGSPVGNLTAQKRDVDSMYAVLQRYGFVSTVCCLGGQGAFAASRQGILAAFGELIQQTLPDDAVVVYYSGHGGLTESNEDEDGPAHRRWQLQYLVPLDWTDASFRGITDIELSALLVRLTAKTTNVTLILDCCHSARMARGSARVKAINPLRYPSVSAHIQELVDSHQIGCDFFPEGNRNVVRIVAAAITESAYEMQFGAVFKGVLTEALVEALEFAQADQGEVSWRAIIFRVRDRVAKTCPQQFVQVEGPSKRICFRLEEEDFSGILPISRNAASGRYTLEGGSLHGVRQGDKYAVMPLGASCITTAAQIATAVVKQVYGARSKISLVWTNENRALPRGAQAFPWMRALNLLPVLATGDDHFINEFNAYLPYCRPNYFRKASAEEEQESLAKIVKEEAFIKILHREQVIIREWRIGVDGEEGDLTMDCLHVLKALAKAHHVLSLRGEQGDHSLLSMLGVEFGRVSDGACEPFAEPSQNVIEGDCVYLKMRNKSQDTTLYVSLLDVCADNVALLSQDSPGGIEIPPGKLYVFGNSIGGKLIGQPALWPSDVPFMRQHEDSLSAQEIPCTVVLVITDRRVNLQCLETDERSIRAEGEIREGSGTELMAIIDQVAETCERTIARSGDQVYEHLHYDIKYLNYGLKPRL
ncbi:hypothetical protein V502_10706 [Pseudogymnoascus sp. VKM F-4520 (FW-2644)]|nr:hypothetical protein V502_10706 [Pseudogymnoascus sp. VKM F-4520 (FW-2644)]